jgi:hypothetical protein
VLQVGDVFVDQCRRQVRNVIVGANFVRISTSKERNPSVTCFPSVVTGVMADTLGPRLITVRRAILVLGSSSRTRDRTYIRQRTVQVPVPISKSGVWPLWPIMPGHPVV